jgi:hypothetical protein
MCNEIEIKIKIIILNDNGSIKGGLGRKIIRCPNMIGGSHLKP